MNYDIGDTRVNLATAKEEVVKLTKAIMDLGQVIAKIETALQFSTDPESVKENERFVLQERLNERKQLELTRALKLDEIKNWQLLASLDVSDPAPSVSKFSFFDSSCSASASSQTHYKDACVDPQIAPLSPSLMRTVKQVSSYHNSHFIRGIEGMSDSDSSNLSGCGIEGVTVTSPSLLHVNLGRDPVYVPRGTVNGLTLRQSSSHLTVQGGEISDCSVSPLFVNNVYNLPIDVTSQGNVHVIPDLHQYQRTDALGSEKSEEIRILEDRVKILSEQNALLQDKNPKLFGLVSMKKNLTLEENQKLHSGTDLFQFESLRTLTTQAFHSVFKERGGKVSYSPTDLRDGAAMFIQHGFKRAFEILSRTDVTTIEEFWVRTEELFYDTWWNKDYKYHTYFGEVFESMMKSRSHHLHTRIFGVMLKFKEKHLREINNAEIAEMTDEMKSGYALALKHMAEFDIRDVIFTTTGEKVLKEVVTEVKPNFTEVSLDDLTTKIAQRISEEKRDTHGFRYPINSDINRREHIAPISSSKRGKDSEGEGAR